MYLEQHFLPVIEPAGLLLKYIQTIHLKKKLEEKFHLNESTL